MSADTNLCRRHVVGVGRVFVRSLLESADRIEAHETHRSPTWGWQAEDRRAPRQTSAYLAALRSARAFTRERFPPQNDTAHIRTGVRRICSRSPVSAHTDQRRRHVFGAVIPRFFVGLETADGNELRSVHVAPLGCGWLLRILISAAATPPAWAKSAFFWVQVCRPQRVALCAHRACGAWLAS